MFYFKAFILAVKFSILATRANIPPNADLLGGLEKISRIFLLCLL